MDTTDLKVPPILVRIEVLNNDTGEHVVDVAFNTNDLRSAASACWRAAEDVDLEVSRRRNG